MWVRAVVSTGFAVLFVGSAVWSRLDRTFPAVDPQLRLEARATVPAPVQAVLRRACYDCHSNETRWPWYSNVPPASWLIAHDVKEGRGQLNLSAWGRYNPFDRADMLDKICDRVSKGRMPMWQYRLLHPEARLSDRDIKTVCDWSETEAARLVQGGT